MGRPKLGSGASAPQNIPDVPLGILAPEKQAQMAEYNSTIQANIDSLDDPMHQLAMGFAQMEPYLDRAIKLGSAIPGAGQYAEAAKALKAFVGTSIPKVAP